MMKRTMHVQARGRHICLNDNYEREWPLVLLIAEQSDEVQQT